MRESMSPEEYQEIAAEEKTKTTPENLESQKKLTDEERKEWEKLQEDPDVQKYLDLESPYGVIEKSSDELTKELEEFKRQHPDIVEKVKKLRELSRKAAEANEFIPSGVKK